MPDLKLKKVKFIFLAAITLIMAMYIFGVKAYAAELSNIELSENGIATWNSDAKPNILYEVRLSRNDEWIGTKHYTYSKKYDLNPLMDKEGIYYVQICPIDSVKRTSSIRCSDTIDINETQALLNKQSCDVDSDDPSQYGWNELNDRSIYRTSDGVKVQDYLTITERGMFIFDKDGYIIKNQKVKIGNKLMNCGKDGVAKEV